MIMGNRRFINLLALTTIIAGGILITSCDGGNNPPITEEDAFSFSISIEGEGSVNLYHDGVEVTNDNYKDLVNPGDQINARMSASSGYRIGRVDFNGTALPYNNGVSTFELVEGKNEFNVSFARVLTESKDFTFELRDDGVYVTAYSCSTSVIPNPVEIPDTVTIDGTEHDVIGIADYTFRNTNVSAISFGKNICTFEVNAFDSASELSRIEVSEENTHFASKDGIVYSKDFTTLYKAPAQTRLSTVDIADETTTISDYAFYRAINVSKINVSENLTTIGDYAFYLANGLRNIDLENAKVTSIGRNAFKNCNSLTSLDLGDYLTEVGEYAFSQCGVRSFTIPGTLKHISTRAFYETRDCTSVVIEEGVESCGNEAFQSVNMSKLVLPSTFREIGDNAFYLCNSLVDLTLNEGLLTIGDGGFHNCVQLTNVNIPSTVSYIGKSAFSRSILLGRDNFTVDPNNPIYYVENNVLYQKDADNGITLHTYFYNRSGEEFVIPEGVTNIRQGSFVEVYALTTLTLPKSLKSIETMAIESLGSVTLNYAGTVKEFSQVTLTTNWCYNTTISNNSQVTCSDGVYTIS